MKVKGYHHHGDKRRQLIAELLSQPRNLLVTILMLNISVNILAQNISSNLFQDEAGWGLKVGVPLALTLIFGEVIPKSVAIQNNSRIALLAAPLIKIIQQVVGPVRRFITALTGVLSQVLFFFLKPEKAMGRDELQHMIASSQESGVLHEEEAELIEGYLRMQDAQARELMRPRDEVEFYDINKPITKLHYFFVEQEISRIPVCDGELDKVVGIVSVRQFLLHRDKIREPRDLKPYVRKPFFVPETTTAKSLFRQFEEKNERIALVVDEYGAISGLITREDLVEEVVGEIIDRRDKGEKYTQAGDGVIIASGKFELADFEELFGVALASPSKVVTIGGWLTEQLGNIPKSGTNHLTDKFLFHVLSADNKRVRRIYIRRLIEEGENG